MQLGNGHATSFWFDKWSPLGRLITLTGPRGFIDLGIPVSSTVQQVISRPQRRRRHRADLFTQIEEAIESARTRLTSREDRPLWRVREDVFQHKFTTSKTWEQIRQAKEVVVWYKGIWFTHNTPKYAFISWLALHNRLTTGDRMAQWGQHVSTCCILCQNNLETRSHLFFSCPYSMEVWTKLMSGLLGHEFSVLWDDIVGLFADNSLDQLDGYIFRYCFQTTLYLIWRERNARRHGQAATVATTLVIATDKMIRNRFSSIRLLGDTRYEDGMQRWFAHNSHPSG